MVGQERHLTRLLWNVWARTLAWGPGAVASGLFPGPPSPERGCRFRWPASGGMGPFLDFFQPLQGCRAIRAQDHFEVTCLPCCYVARAIRLR
jgi:hypothetical protein